MKNKKFDCVQFQQNLTVERKREIKKDKVDYYSALKVKITNEKWTSHADLKKRNGFEIAST